MDSRKKAQDAQELLFVHFVHFCGNSL